MDQAFRKTLTKQQMRRLSRYECGLCEQSLDKTVRYGCSAYYCDHHCSDDQIKTRAIRCLDHAAKTAIRYTENAASRADKGAV